MNIGIVASEAFPFAKTGGLADVTGSLFKIFGDLNNETLLFMPLYKNTKSNIEGLQQIGSINIDIGNKSVVGNIYSKRIFPKSKTIFIAADEYFDRDELYGIKGVDYPDNAERFGFFDKAVLEAIKILEIKLDVLHLNDWQTGLIPLFIKESSSNIKTVFTIHNLAYQGNFSSDVLDTLHIDRKYYTPSQIEFYGKMSFLKTGLIYSDYITTVSPTYAKEILTNEFGEKLEGVLNSRRSNLVGILNGVDYNVWNPENDKAIYFRFNENELDSKDQNKKAFLKEIGISNFNAPLFGMVTRIAAQKGLDILIDALIDFLPNTDATVAILGTGDKELENSLEKLQTQYPEKLLVIIGFDEKMAHKIYASSDFFLMPSKYEPCGLGQLIALKYGTLPVVNETGGLKDTVDDYNEYTQCGDGFKMTDYSKEALMETLNRACLIYKDYEKFSEMKKSAMKVDFSWENSAKKYVKLFTELLGK